MLKRRKHDIQAQATQVVEQHQSQHIKDEIEAKQNEVIKLQTELIMLLSQQVAGLSSVIREVAPILPKGPARTPEEGLAAQKCLATIAEAQQTSLRIQALSDQAQSLRLDIARIKAIASNEAI